MKFCKPLLPQYEDKRKFAIGSKVRAFQTFHRGCPPTGDKIDKGTLGKVVRHIEREDFLGPIRMIVVQWETGLTCEARDSLLEVEE